MRLGVGPLADHGLHRIAGRDVEQQEGDGQHAEQGRDQQRQPGQQEAASPGTRSACSPPLAGEDGRDPPALHVGLHGPDVDREPEEDPGRQVEDPRVDLAREPRLLQRVGRGCARGGSSRRAPVSARNA